MTTTRHIPLTNGGSVLVDEFDFHLYGGKSWRLNSDKSPYAVRTERRGGKRKNVYLHREIMGDPPGHIVNHKNGNTLDCTRDNMNVIRWIENSTTARVRKGAVGFIGVSLQSGLKEPHPVRRSYRASITGPDRVRAYLGSFHTPEEAARAYDTAAVQMFGALACTNFPLSTYLCPWSPPKTEARMDNLRSIPF